MLVVVIKYNELVMKYFKTFFLCGVILTLEACSKDEEIQRLLKSKNIDNIINGAVMAGDSGDRKYATLLLTDAADQRATTMLRFKGYSIYQVKMYALEKIFKHSPPVKITSEVDSVVIKYYENLDSVSKPSRPAKLVAWPR